MDALAHLDDKELIRRVLAAGRDREAAFAALIGRHQDRIFKLLGRFTRDVQETEDLAQEVFVKVFRKLHTFQFDSSFFTWLYRISVNTASDHLTRKRRRPVALSEDVGELDRGDSHPRNPSLPREQPEDALLQHEMAQVTRQILDRLPPKYRTVLLLREYEDLSYTEMATSLNCSIGTIESRLFRARQRFKEALERLHPELLPTAAGGSNSARGGTR